MSPDILNRIGLCFGLISGLLFIPEILNLIPFDQVEAKIKKWLDILEKWSGFPQKLHPQSWKRIFAEEARQKYIEPITATLGLLSSVTWIITIVIGVYTSSTFFILLGLMLPIYVTIERILQNFQNRLSITRFTLYFFYGLVLTLIVAPLISFIRVAILVFRAIILSIKESFARHKILRSMITLIAVLLFIASNILQILATY